nr:restriction endonuclease subunit S [uncultured Treponema sp.]
MKEYRKLGKYIQQVDVRNTDLSITRLLGLSINKCFIESIANTIGTDFRPYKIVKKGQFAYGPVTSRNGEKITIALLEEPECIISSSYAVFEITDTSKLLPEYLMLWFSRPEFDRYARYKSHGSVREIFDWDEMCRVELPVPPLNEQQKIVDTYNAITNRIQIKQKINENLEKTAQAIYRKMFIEDKGKNATLADIYQFQYGKGNNNPNNGGKYPIYGSNGVIGGFTEFNAENTPVIGHIGSCGSLCFAFGKCYVTYNGIMCYIKNSGYKYFGYFTLKSLNLLEQVRGSTQPFISYDMLYEMKIFMPIEDNTIQEFEVKANTIMNNINNNNEDIRKLEKLKNIVVSQISKR